MGENSSALELESESACCSCCKSSKEKAEDANLKMLEERGYYPYKINDEHQMKIAKDLAEEKHGVGADVWKYKRNKYGFPEDVGRICGWIHSVDREKNTGLILYTELKEDGGDIKKYASFAKSDVPVMEKRPDMWESLSHNVTVTFALEDFGQPPSTDEDGYAKAYNVMDILVM